MSSATSESTPLLPTRALTFDLAPGKAVVLRFVGEHQERNNEVLMSLEMSAWRKSSRCSLGQCLEWPIAGRSAQLLESELEHSSGTAICIAQDPHSEGWIKELVQPRHLARSGRLLATHPRSACRCDEEDQCFRCRSRKVQVQNRQSDTKP